MASFCCWNWNTVNYFNISNWVFKDISGLRSQFGGYISLKKKNLLHMVKAGIILCSSWISFACVCMYVCVLVRVCMCMRLWCMFLTVCMCMRVWCMFLTVGLLWSWLYPLGDRGGSAGCRLCFIAVCIRDRTHFFSYKLTDSQVFFRLSSQVRTSIFICFVES